MISKSIIFFSLILTIFIAIFFCLLPIDKMIAQNVEDDGEPAEDTVPEGIVPEDGRATIKDPLEDRGLNDVIRAIFNVAYALAGAVAAVFLVFGGYQYMTSSGNPDMVATAKSTIINSIIGLVIILTSWLIIRYVLEALNINL